LDKYYEAETTKLFTVIAIKAAHKFQVEMNSVHLDGTSMCVEGEYKKEGEEINEINQEAELNKKELEPEMKPIEIVHGYSLL